MEITTKILKRNKTEKVTMYTLQKAKIKIHWNIVAYDSMVCGM